MPDLFSMVMGLGGATAQAFGAQAGGQAISSAAKDANQVRMSMFNQANQAWDPYLMAGNKALPGLEALNTPGQSASYLSSMPGYQFTLDQGSKIAQSGYAAKGLGSSGEAMKGGINFAEGLAGTTLQQQFDMLMKQAGFGPMAAQGITGAAMNTGAGMAENLLTSGKGWAAADMATGNAIASGMTGASNMSQQQQYLDLLKSKYGMSGGGDASSAMLNPNIGSWASAGAGLGA